MLSANTLFRPWLSSTFSNLTCWLKSKNCLKKVLTFHCYVDHLETHWVFNHDNLLPCTWTSGVVKNNRHGSAAATSYIIRVRLKHRQGFLGSPSGPVSWTLLVWLFHNLWITMRFLDTDFPHPPSLEEGSLDLFNIFCPPPCRQLFCLIDHLFFFFLPHALEMLLS